MSDEDESSRFDLAYRETPPWDIGRAQPALIELFDEFPPAAPALDVGCGAGELSLELARRGLSVLGMDAAPAAISRARAKVAEAPPNVRALLEFQVGDALHPSALSRHFATIVDSGFYHLFDQPERDLFVQELAAVLPAGGRYYLLGFAFDSPVPNAPRPVSEEELRARFAPGQGWNILALRPARFLIRQAPDGVPALVACLQRT